MIWKQKPPLGTPLIPKHPHLDGLVGWWLFQEGGGDQVYDLSGNDHTGTLNGFAFPATTSSGWNPGAFGAALLFDSNDDVIDVGAMSIVDNAAFTISARFKTENVGVTQITLFGEGNTGNNGPFLSLRANNGTAGQIEFAIRDDANDTMSMDHGTTWNDGIWHQVAVVKLAANNWLLYIDGIQKDSSGTASGATTTDTTAVGALPRIATSFFWDGYLDDVRIYNRALTAAEIMGLYINPFAAFWLWPLAQIYPPIAAPIVTYYPDLVYPSDPEFPAGHDDVPIAGDFYTATTSQITALAAEATLLFDQIGNIELGATEGVAWNDGIRIDLSSGEIQIIPLQVNTELVVDTPTLNTLNVTGDIVVSNDLTASFAPVTVGGVVTADYVDRLVYKLTSQIDEPGDPADNHAVFWMSSGVGFGDAADFCCKITEGGGTTDFIISDYSTL